MADRLSQQQMIARIREALGGAPGSEPAASPHIGDELVRLTPPDADLIALFTEGAEFVGREVRPTAAADAPAALTGALAELGARRITASLDRLGDLGDRLAEAVSAAGVETVEWRGSGSLRPHFDADAGVSDVHAALAETGTLICTSGPAHSRGTSLAVPHHVAVVRRSDILPDMFDYLDALPQDHAALLPSSISFITGPSKTADIEGVLITGVHGPGRVVILLIGDA